MTDELRALTDELQRTTAMLERVLERLDAAEKRADRHQTTQRLLALGMAAWVLLGGAFLWDAHNERGRMCSAVRDGFEQFTAAAVSTSDEPIDEARVAAFRAEMDRRLAECG